MGCTTDARDETGISRTTPSCGLSALHRPKGPTMEVVHTPTVLQGVITALFVGTWIVLGIVSFVVFFRCKDTALKRKWWPRFVVLVGVLFVFFSSSIAVLGSQ